ncbi:MAG: phosphoenolpyruvate--protein phosphotransferase [Geminicoccaceae bacterium]
MIAGRGGWGGDEPSAPKAGSAPPTGARRLLRRLIEVVAEPTTPQQRLDSITSMIAANLVAEVCSVYVLRAGEILELFATEGLAREAVHRTRMRVGEGLVGTIAAQAVVISTENAQQHPNFRYFPETREELYQTFLGVPILRAGKVVGVLVVQNRARRAYQDDEVEAMQIIATVLAEMFVSGGLVDLSQYGDVASAQREPRRLEGLRLVEGVAVGRAWLHEPRVEITRILSDDPEAEHRRLEQAFIELRAALDAMLAHPDLAAGEQREVIEAYRMFANDRGWMRRIREAVDSGLSAEAAVRRVQDETRARIGHAADPFMRERLLDLDDIADRLLRHLVGRPTTIEPKDLPDDLILVARTLSPADLMEYDRRRLRGIVLEEGSKTAHVTIVARAFDVPVVGRVDAAMSVIDQGNVVVLDGENGHIFVRPSEEVQSSFHLAIRARAERRQTLVALRDAPSVTADGVPVSLAINAAFLIDMNELAASGADGCGLFRTELAFMSRHQHPDLAAQTQLYAKVLEQAEGRRVVFRTLDVGGDKRLPYWTVPAEENPAMGWRALRIALDRPAVLRDQLRALIAAAGGRPLAIMFPMVAEVAELDAARALLRRELSRAEAAGQLTPERLEVGAMLEVPALLWQFDALLQRVDFLSVGSNDLLQFMFACDRGNPALADRYDSLSPSALSLFRDIVERCRAAGVRLCFCGEMAGRPLDAMALLGVGVRELSVSVTDIGPIKAMLRSVDLGALSAYVRSILHLPDRSLRGRLRSYALDHRIVLPDGAYATM